MVGVPFFLCPCQFVTYNLQIIQLGPEVWNADFLLLSDAGIGGPTDGSMFGHACASNCVAVAAMDWVRGRHLAAQ